MIGFLIVAVVGLAYMLIAKPYQRSTAPEGDAIEIADIPREHRAQHDMAQFASDVPLAEPSRQPVTTSD